VVKATKLENGQVEILLETQAEIDGFKALYNEPRICEAVGFSQVIDAVWDTIEGAASRYWVSYSDNLDHLIP